MAGDPWVIQPHEHAKFAEHFRNLGPTNGNLSGEQAKRFMLQSQLPPPVLGQIWSLADCNADGKLDLKEFSIACKIINLKLHGIEIPKVLPPSLLGSLSPAGPPQQQFPPVKPPIPPMPSVPPQPLISAPPQPLISAPPQPLISASQPATQSLLGDFSQPAIPIRPAAPIPVPDLISGVKPLSQPITSQPVMGTAPLISQSVMGTAPMIPNQPIMTSQPMVPSQPIPPVVSPIVSPMSQPLIPNQPLTQNPPLISGISQPLVGPPLIPSPPKPLVGGTTLGSLVSSPPKAVNVVAGSFQPVTSTPIAAVKEEMSMSKPGSAAGSLVSSVVTSPLEPLGVMSPPALAEWAVPQPLKLK